jgi:hypothetical protein
LLADLGDLSLILHGSEENIFHASCQFRMMQKSDRVVPAQKCAVILKVIEDLERRTGRIPVTYALIERRVNSRTLPLLFCAILEPRICLVREPQNRPSAITPPLRVHLSLRLAQFSGAARGGKCLRAR